MRRHTVGSLPAWALSTDQRFSYYAYVPETRGPGPVELVVLVHGVTRKAQGYRDRFVAWAEATGCALLAPLFPCGIVRAEDIDNYRHVLYEGIRYDQVLLDMVAELSARHDLAPGLFYLHGFSAGGQFVQRFHLLHPDRLRAVSIAAPSDAVSLTSNAGWPEGTADIEAVFGRSLDRAALAEVPVQTLIGDLDTGAYDPMTGEELAEAPPGRSRPEILGRTVAELEHEGARVEHAVVPGVGHESGAMTAYVQEFFVREGLGRAGL
jgi:pimeloyl-ACP methyl ester carboxylesterase